MADTAPRRYYAGDYRPVAVKQRTQEASRAYPEHNWADNKAGETAVKRDGVHGDHGGTKFVGDGVPATAVDKTAKQQWNEHYGIETMPKVHQSRATAHRRALATEKWNLGWVRRPRGRRQWNSSFRWRQTELVGRPDVQGVGGAGASLSAMAEHDSDGTGSPEMSKVTGRKQSKGKEERRRLQSFIGQPRKRKEATTKPSARQRDA